MKKINLVVTALLLSPLSAYTQPGDYGPSAGAQELTLSGTGTNDDGFNNGSWGIAASYGKYLDDNLQWVLRQSVNYADTPGDNSGSASTRLGIDYNFDLGNWRPFVGINIGYIYGDAVENTGIASPEIGVKYYVKPETFLFVQTEYQYFFDDTDGLTDNFDNGAYAHSLGVGFNFGP